jgi:catechol 2,3-dioxygenase
MAQPNLTHMGIYTDDIERLQEFYTKVLGLVVTDSGVGNVFKRNLVFMSGDPSQHHQFVLASRLPGDPPRGPLFQASFKVKTLTEMREMVERARANGAENIRAMDHGNAWSLYFCDPEANVIEIYMDTRWYVPQPYADDLRLDLSDDEILRRSDARVMLEPGHMPLAEWSANIAKKLAEMSGDAP